MMGVQVQVVPLCCMDLYLVPCTIVHAPTNNLNVITYHIPLKLQIQLTKAFYMETFSFFKRLLHNSFVQRTEQDKTEQIVLHDHTPNDTK